MAQNVATAISGVSVSETGNTTTSGEIFTVVVSDGSGVLSANAGATGGGGTITPSNGNKTLTIVRDAVAGQRRPHDAGGRRQLDERGYAERLGDRQLRQQRDEVASGDGDPGDGSTVRGRAGGGVIGVG